MPSDFQEIARFVLLNQLSKITQYVEYKETGGAVQTRRVLRAVFRAVG
jgi:hypothetical protein